MHEEMVTQEMQHDTHEQREKPSIGAVALVSLVTFLVPVLTIPFFSAPLQFSKTLVVVAVVAILYSMFVLTSMRRGAMVKYWSIPLALFSLLPVVYLITATFSEAPGRSFFGYQLETDTFGFVLLAMLLTNAVVLLVQQTQLSTILKTALAASWVVFIFQLAQLAAGLLFGHGLLGTVTTNMLGRWNDFGMFAGLIGALALLSLFALRLQKFARVALTVTFIVAIFFLTLVNLFEAWVLFGVVSFGLLALLFVQFGSVRDKKTGFSMFLLPAVGVIAAVFFGFFGGGVAGALQDSLGITTLEVRPSISGTIEVLQQTYRDTPVLGSGPNTFASQWLAYRDDSVLNTIFWNTEFNVGSGTIPTTFVTGGMLTAGLWILFTLFLIATVLRALFVTPIAGGMYASVVLSGVATLYLLAMHYVYAPSQSLTLLFALALGVFFASVKDTPLMHTLRIGASSPHMRFVMTLSTVVVLVVALFSVYGVGRTYASVILHERAIQVSNAGNLERGHELIQQALALRAQDRYYRTAAQINVAELNQLVNADAAAQDAAQVFQDTLSEAVQYARAAVGHDPTSFQNWLILANVYSSVIPLQIQGALENARATLEETRTRSPKSPEVDYRLAQIEVVTNGDVDTARTYLEAALAKKQDYTQAILLLAQIELSQGNLDKAIESVRAAVYFEPTNSVLLYQLGILLLQDQNYTQAALAFEAALEQQPDYSNAAFFLAQSYAFLDRLPEAATLMAQVSERNPESELARVYATQLAAGDNPFDAGNVASPEADEDTVE